MFTQKQPTKAQRIIGKKYSMILQTVKNEEEEVAALESSIWKIPTSRSKSGQPSVDMEAKDAYFSRKKVSVDKRYIKMLKMQGTRNAPVGGMASRSRNPPTTK